ncbi:transposase [Streptomyces olivaceoviridis]|uniref:transposase n=1 Tax=Streptomyces olivaceoviridis TaxID=1921 RepID=UPI003682A664
MSLPHRDTRREAQEQLSCFRNEFHSCPTTRSDALSELADAVPCGEGPVRSLPELSLVSEHRRDHGGLYSALARARVDADRLRRVVSPSLIEGCSSNVIAGRPPTVNLVCDDTVCRPAGRHTGHAGRLPGSGAEPAPHHWGRQFARCQSPSRTTSTPSDSGCRPE